MVRFVMLNQPQVWMVISPGSICQPVTPASCRELPWAVERRGSLEHPGVVSPWHIPGVAPSIWLITTTYDRHNNCSEVGISADPNRW